jgi:hypothetical protein
LPVLRFSENPEQGVIASVNDTGNTFIAFIASVVENVHSSLPMSLTPVNNLQCRISSRIFGKKNKNNLKGMGIQ